MVDEGDHLLLADHAITISVDALEFRVNHFFFNVVVQVREHFVHHLFCGIMIQQAVPILVVVLPV